MRSGMALTRSRCGCSYALTAKHWSGSGSALSSPGWWRALLWMLLVELMTLSLIEGFRGREILKVLVVGQDLEGLCGTLELRAPLFQALDNCEQLLVVDLILHSTVLCLLEKYATGQRAPALSIWDRTPPDTQLEVSISSTVL